MLTHLRAPRTLWLRERPHSACSSSRLATTALPNLYLPLGGNHDRAFVHLVWPPTSGFTALNSRTPALPHLSPIWIPSAGPRTNSIDGTLRGVNDNRAIVYIAPHDEIYRSVRHRRLAPTMAHSPANRPRTRSRVALHVSPRVAPFPVKSASGAHA